jgi:UPF0716 family protein affecting phage T7 exclusion
MAILRNFGYAIGIIILIVGIVSFPLGLVLIIPAVIMLWLLKKGGQVSKMQKDLKELRRLEEERMRDNIQQRRNDIVRQEWGQ